MIHLHVRSLYSPLKGTASLDKLIKKCKEFGQYALALTDNGLYGIVHFIEKCRKEKIHPIVGFENEHGGHFVILAKDMQGYQALCFLISFPDLSLEERLKRCQGHCVIFSRDRSFIQKIHGFWGNRDLYWELNLDYNGDDLHWAGEQKIPLLVTSQVKFLEEGDWPSYRLLRAIGKRVTLEQIGESEKEHFMHSPEFLKERLSLYPEAFKNTDKVAKQCIWKFEFSLILPRYQKLSWDEGNKKLRSLCYQKITLKFGSDKKALKRLEHELSIIELRGFSHYFLVVWDLVKDNPITCGRGSAAASLVSYLLDITHVDPLKHNLFFERFLNVDRDDPPDIDVDFPWDTRDEVIDTVFSRYHHCVAMVGNHNTFQWRSALREVANVWGIPKGEINYVIERYPHLPLSQVWIQIVTAAKKIEGLFQHLSLHSGGIVITPEKTTLYAPFQKMPKGVVALQWDKDQVEMAKLVKIDFLGNRSLAVIRDCLEELSLDYNFDPTGDFLMEEKLRSGDTMGCFYIESPASRLFLKKMNSSQFENVVIATSIIRPASNKFANLFIKRLKGEKFEHLHPLLEGVLGDTLGILVYQEQLAQVCMVLADFTAHEGNTLRKMIGNKNKVNEVLNWKKRFWKNARKKGLSDNILGKVWEMMESFKGYSFCRPHSASYALVSLKSLYLKAHHPALFWSHVLNHGGGYYSSQDYLEEARSDGVEIFPPDIQWSDINHVSKKNTLRLGLAQIKGVSGRTLLKIIEEREKTKFISLDDFLERVVPPFDEARSFVRTRCFRSIQKESFPAQMWKVYFYQKGEKFLMENVPSTYGEWQWICWEKETLGQFVTLSYWDLYKRYIPKKRVSSQLFYKYKNKSVCSMGKLVTLKRVLTKQREEMCFATFRDDKSLFETVLFPKVYKKYRSLLFSKEMFILWGEIQESFQTYQLIIDHLEKIVHQERDFYSTRKLEVENSSL